MENRVYPIKCFREQINSRTIKEITEKEEKKSEQKLQLFFSHDLPDFLFYYRKNIARRGEI